jgi:DNA-directed RNA polymerase subunit RPC12/RpoP
MKNKMSEYEGGTFRCVDCGKEFLTKDAADRHYRNTHGEEETRALE